MKKLLIGLSLLALSASASAGDFFGGNDGEWKQGPYGPYYEESDWPEWTPMYWMDEMMNSFDDEEDGGSFGNMPFMGNNSSFGNMPFMGNNNNYPMMPYGGAPMMAPQMQMPYAAPQMGMPMMAPMPAPQMQGAPVPMMPAPMAAPGATPGPSN